MERSMIDGDPWDLSKPGTGSARATAITQLYFRLMSYSPVVVTLADALCIVFGAQGATNEELQSYLGFSEESVTSGLESIPLNVRCTSVELNGEEDSDGRPQNRPSSPAQKEAVRHYLNYKRLLPVAYAHVSRVLLALCVTPLPDNQQTREAQQRKGGAPKRDGDVAPSSFLPAPEPVATTSEATGVVLKLSPWILQRDVSEGIMCRSCRFYVALEEVVCAMCPMCKSPLLHGIIHELKHHMDSTTSEGGSLVTLLPQVSRALAQVEPASPSSTTTTTAASPFASKTKSFPKTPSMNTKLAQDPFLLQQALYFLYLFSSPLACINDRRYVVDTDDILTAREFELRMQGKATVADAFRVRHRNAASIHVQLLPQKTVDTAKLKANEQKMAKRAHLPPWLRAAPMVFLEGSSSSSHSFHPFTEATQESKEQATTGSCTSTAAGRRPQPTTMKKKRARAQEDAIPINSTAAFISSEFYFNDYDEVPLPKPAPLRCE